MSRKPSVRDIQSDSLRNTVVEINCYAVKLIGYAKRFLFPSTMAGAKAKELYRIAQTVCDYFSKETISSYRSSEDYYQNMEYDILLVSLNNVLFGEPQTDNFDANHMLRHYNKIVAKRNPKIDYLFNKKELAGSYVLLLKLYKIVWLNCSIKIKNWTNQRFSSKSTYRIYADRSIVGFTEDLKLNSTDAVTFQKITSASYKTFSTQAIFKAWPKSPFTYVGQQRKVSTQPNSMPRTQSNTSLSSGSDTDISQILIDDLLDRLIKQGVAVPSMSLGYKNI